MIYCKKCGVNFVGFHLCFRMLYFDDQEIVFELTRPIGFNGINLAANKSDILDRGLNIDWKGLMRIE
jgi:hypothetical protein